MTQRNTRLTNEEFIERMNNINPNIKFLSKYKTRKTRIDCLCEQCGYEWQPTADELLGGRGCPKCAIKLRPQCNPKSHEDFIKDFNKNGDKNIIILNKYTNVKTKIHCKCKICGYEWYTIPSVLLKGHGCKKCSDYKNTISQRKTHKQFILDFNKLGNKNVEIIGNYINSSTKIKCKCKICGRIYDGSPIHLLGGQGCIECYRKNNVGKNHPKWNVHKTIEEREIERKYSEYQEFIYNCLERDNYTCQLTLQKGGKLNVHHLNGYNWCKEQRTDINNGITLAESIHKEFHSIYGYGMNTIEQFIEFVNKLYIDKRITNIGYNLLLEKIKNE